MATGDSSNIFARLRSYLPAGWFPDSAPILAGVLSGIASVLSVSYGLFIYAKAQTRILTATDGWLDLISYDFFGSNLPRKTGETDAAFLARIRANLFQERATRKAYTTVLTTLTGYAPIIFEPANPYDTGAMNASTSAGFCGVGRMGSIAMPYTVLVTAYRPKLQGASMGMGFADAPKITAMNTPLSTSYNGSLSNYTSAASDADIYAAVNATRAEGITAWVAITNHS
ncbi:hypothetical protein FHW67_002707 [Herbaspirillum sp. Sphag1AN]|uniref:hypothetical protein n=1 Tax=unclassified Herbaspirillum TaxID=2624150 RepID=UPI00160D63EF|nr:MULTISPECIES: hypothetical protein [unclassified Herbaspirillum]MBB3213415.1 hypothetical protein [Herbaspirillum sp. Sphag1AN]MBB3246541.1 hypothetical protein [Herbaspirillum sp. Sphag64]